MAIVMFQIHVKVKPDKLDEFMEVALLDARETVKETGNLRFEVYRRQESPTELVVFEIYRSEEAVEAHRQTDHIKAWRSAVAAYADEYTRVLLTPVFPSEVEWTSKSVL
ncbi:MAG: antibiotic biosynthesis monooxygenase [Anaerolineae bacterium]|nr:antibiotic biosynthesis monooxygenase [Anaerolineae bacterium]